MVALYHFATGGKDGPFPETMLRRVYVAKSERGNWGTDTHDIRAPAH